MGTQSEKNMTYSKGLCANTVPNYLQSSACSWVFFCFVLFCIFCSAQVWNDCIITPQTVSAGGGGAESRKGKDLRGGVVPQLRQL